jgi:hypothetical protein
MELRKNLPIILISIGIITIFFIFIGIILYLNFSDETHHFVTKYVIPIILVIIMLGLFMALVYAIIRRIRHTPMIFDPFGGISRDLIQDDRVIIHTPEYNGRHPAFLEPEYGDVSRRSSVSSRRRSSPSVMYSPTMGGRDTRSSSESVPVIEPRQSAVPLPFPRRSVNDNSSDIRYVTPPRISGMSGVSGTPSSMDRIPFPRNRNTNITPPMTPETTKARAQNVRIVTEKDQYGRVIREYIVPMESHQNFSRELSPPRNPRNATSSSITLEDVKSDSSADELDTSGENSD